MPPPLQCIAGSFPLYFPTKEAIMVIFFDIDGTIIDDATQVIPASAASAIAALVRNGHVPVVNTGRPFGHIDPRVRALPFRGYVCACGMERILDGQVRFRTQPGEALRRYTVASVRTCRINALYEGENAVLTDGRWSLCPAGVKECARMWKKGFAVREISAEPGLDFIKFVTLDAPGCDRAEILRRLSPYYTCIDRGGGMIEYVLKGYSKAAGLAAMLRDLGASREQAYAIGDSTNDLPMFEAARHTAALGDGMPELQAKAEYITAPVLENGLEQALKHWKLI